MESSVLTLSNHSWPQAHIQLSYMQTARLDLWMPTEKA